MICKKQKTPKELEKTSNENLDKTALFVKKVKYLQIARMINKMTDVSNVIMYKFSRGINKMTDVVSLCQFHKSKYLGSAGK